MRGGVKRMWHLAILFLLLFHFTVLSVKGGPSLSQMIRIFS